MVVSVCDPGVAGQYRQGNILEKRIIFIYIGYLSLHGTKLTSIDHTWLRSVGIDSIGILWTVCTWILSVPNSSFHTSLFDDGNLGWF